MTPPCFWWKTPGRSVPASGGTDGASGLPPRPSRRTGRSGPPVHPRPATPDTPAWSAEHGTATGTLAPFWEDGTGFLVGFQVLWGFSSEDIVVTARPAGAEEAAEVAVAHEFDETDMWGSVTHRDVRAAVGDGPSEVSLYVDGDLLSRMDLPAAEALAEEPPMRQGAWSYPVTVHGFDRPYPFEAWPLHRELYNVDNVARLEPVDAYSFMDPLAACGLAVTVVDAPDHGRLEEYEGEYSYAPEAHYAGEDSFTLAVTDGTSTKTFEMTMLMTEDYLSDEHPRSSHTHTCPWEGQDDAGEEAEPPAPAPSEEGGHEVPETVETGRPVAWWLAGLGALGAGLLLRFRRGLGLT